LLKNALISSSVQGLRSGDGLALAQGFGCTTIQFQSEPIFAGKIWVGTTCPCLLCMLLLLLLLLSTTQVHVYRRQAALQTVKPSRAAKH